MKKNRIVSLLFVFAVIAITQIYLGVSAHAATIDGTTTTMSYDVLGGGSSYAPYELSINPSGEYCTRDFSLTLRIQNIAASYRIQNVNYEISAQNGYGPIYTKTISDTVVDGCSWVYFRFSSLPACDRYTVKANAVDNLGNTYTWTKNVKRDRNNPSINDLSISSQGRSLIATDGKLIVDNDVNLSFSVNDLSSLYSSWIKEISLQVYASSQTQPIKDTNITLNHPSNRNIGYYESYIPLLGLGNTEQTITVRITATDYAYNEITYTKVFYYDKKPTLGTLSKGNQSSSSVDIFFTPNSDISGLMYCKFYILTTNGTFVQTEAYGTKVSNNLWKLTLDRSTLNSSNGLFRLDVWSMDNLNNPGVVGTIYHQF